MNNELINVLSGSVESSMTLFYSGVALTLVFAIILGLLLWKKGKNIAILSSFVFGVAMMLIFMLIHWTEEATINHDAVEKVAHWYQWVGTIFVLLMVIVLPVFIFLVVVNFMLNKDLGNIKGSTYVVSFTSLIGLAFFGILIALLISPLMYLMPNDWFGLDGAEGELEDEGVGILGYFSSWQTILFMIFMGLFIGGMFRYTSKDNEPLRERYRAQFQKILGYVTYYIKIIIYLVPFVILTRLSVIGMGDVKETSGLLAIMGCYMGMWWLGALIIMGAMTLAIVLLGFKGTKKERLSIVADQILVTFSTQSISASLPETQENARRLGVCDEISNLTPTKGTIMGMVMCNGFSPMLIILFTIMNDNGGYLDWGTVFVAMALVLALTISASGQGSADVFILSTTFNTLHISMFMYLTVLVPIQEINERTIRTPNNSLGHLVATLITERWHKKTTNKDNSKKELKANKANEKNPSK